jgi:hypothetical protein
VGPWLRFLFSAQTFRNALALYDCHPEAPFWPKDLPEYVGFSCRFLAFRRKSLARKPGRSNELRSSRKVLRPKSGLRMTVMLNPALTLPVDN